MHPDDALIEFIHQYTGKMKPLAESDLESYLSLGIQLINIGKPFHLEGIGSVYRSKEDKFDFLPGEFSQVKLVLPGEEQVDSSEKRKTNFDAPASDKSNQPASARRVFLALGIVVGLALIAWGGYDLYKKKTTESSQESSVQAPALDTSASQKDSLNLISRRADSLKAAASIQAQSDTSKYKFVILGTTNRKRAERRYGQLLSFATKVKMQSKDSTFFQVYFSLPATPKDTLRIKDSLSAYYATKTTIEQ